MLSLLLFVILLWDEHVPTCLVKKSRHITWLTLLIRGPITHHSPPITHHSSLPPLSPLHREAQRPAPKTPPDVGSDGRKRPTARFHPECGQKQGSVPLSIGSPFPGFPVTSSPHALSSKTALLFLSSLPWRMCPAILIPPRRAGA